MKSLLSSPPRRRFAYGDSLRKFSLLGFIALMLLEQQPVVALAQSLPAASLTAQSPVRGQISIGRDVQMAPSDAKISLNMRDASLRDVLNMIAKQGNFNLILDESVEGTLTVDVSNVSINKALEYIFTVANLSYKKDGNTMIVATAEAAGEKNLNAQTFKAIPVLYKNAMTIAGQLNQTLFSIPRPGGSNRAIAASDPDTNSLLIMGTDADIKLVGDALRELDVPRNRKVYRIRYNDPSYIAQILIANFFADMGAMMAGGGGAAGMAGGAGGAAGGAAAGGGGGAAGAGGAGGAAGGAAAGGGGAAAGGGGAAAGGGGAAGAGGAAGGGGAAAGGGAAGMIMPLTSGGVTLIPEPITSTLTVLGTDEQIALVDSLIQDIDVRRPQVSIEVALVEMQHSDAKRMIPTLGAIRSGQWSLNLIPNSTNTSSTLGWSGLPQASVPFMRQFSLEARMSNSSGKVLANPNIVALDGTTSTLDISDEVPSVTETITVTNGISTTVTTINKEKAGITLSITPQITYDGSVMLNIVPKISQPTQLIEAGGASTFLISTRNLEIASARVMDGQTLAIGGILREASTKSMRNVPGLSDLPIVGAMFRATNGDITKNRTELVLLVTPHILKEDAVPFFTDPNNTTQGRNNPNQGGIQPISLPKFIGPTSDSKAPAANSTARQQVEVSPALPSQGQEAALKSAEKAVLSPPVKAVEQSAETPVLRTVDKLWTTPVTQTSEGMK